MLTGSNSRADVDRSREVGASGYVTKDRIASELLDAIVEVTQRPATLEPDGPRSSRSPRCSSWSALCTLILMHTGRDAGMGGMGFTPASQGGTHIVERNLTRFTLVLARAVLREQHRPLPLPRLTHLGEPCRRYNARALALVAELVDALG